MAEKFHAPLDARQAAARRPRAADDGVPRQTFRLPLRGTRLPPFQAGPQAAVAPGVTADAISAVLLLQPAPRR